jgi:hypothetical protein
MFLHGGGTPPDDLILPLHKMIKLAKAPTSFILALPLKPGHTFSAEELARIELQIKSPTDTPPSRTIREEYILWTLKPKYGPILSSNRPVEAITSQKIPFVMAGQGSFWPIPLQREGWGATVMWRAFLPREITNSEANQLVGRISKKWQGPFWTLSKK